MLVGLLWLLVAVERVDWVVDTLLGKEDILGPLLGGIKLFWAFSMSLWTALPLR